MQYDAYLKSPHYFRTIDTDGDAEERKLLPQKLKKKSTDRMGSFKNIKGSGVNLADEPSLPIKKTNLSMFLEDARNEIEIQTGSGPS